MCRFVLSLFIPHLFFLKYFGKAVLRECGLSWVTFFLCFIISIFPFCNNCPLFPLLSVSAPYTLAYIMRTRLFKYIEDFTIKKGKFSIKKSDIFHISAQNIDCGYSLEPPRRGGSNEYPQSMFLAK